MPKKYKKFKKKPDKNELSEINANDNTAVKPKYGQSPKKERTPEEKREYLKLFFYLVGWIIITSAVYMTCINFAFKPILYIYLSLTILLFFVWLIYNGGFKKPDISKYEKPGDMGYDEFCAFIENLKERQKKSKYFLILFIPFPLIMLMDYIIMVWGDKLTR